MAQAKISRIEPANPPTWTGSHGLMYAFDVDLSDGTTGTVNCKTPNKWNVGDDVEYTASSTHHGTKLRLDKPGFSGGGFTFPSGGNDDATKGIIASWAVGVAMQVADRDASNYDVQVMQYARLALELGTKSKTRLTHDLGIHPAPRSRMVPLCVGYGGRIRLRGGQVGRLLVV